MIRETKSGFVFDVEGQRVELLNRLLSNGERKEPQEWLDFNEDGFRPPSLRTLYQIVKESELQQNEGNSNQKRLAQSCENLFRQRPFVNSGINYKEGTSAIIWHITPSGERIEDRVEVPLSNDGEVDKNNKITIPLYYLGRSEPLPKEFESLFNALLGLGFETAGRTIEYLIGIDSMLSVWYIGTCFVLPQKRNFDAKIRLCVYETDSGIDDYNVLDLSLPFVELGQSSIDLILNKCCSLGIRLID